MPRWRATTGANVTISDLAPSSSVDISLSLAVSVCLLNLSLSLLLLSLFSFSAGHQLDSAAVRPTDSGFRVCKVIGCTTNQTPCIQRKLSSMRRSYHQPTNHRVCSVNCWAYNACTINIDYRSVWGLLRLTQINIATLTYYFILPVGSLSVTYSKLFYAILYFSI